MTIRMELVADDHQTNPLGSTYIYYTRGGAEIPIGLTEETGIEVANRLLAVFNANEQEVTNMTSAYEVALAENDKLVEQGKPGKRWPAFAERERVLNRLCKEAGVVDT